MTQFVSNSGVPINPESTYFHDSTSGNPIQVTQSNGLPIQVVGSKYQDLGQVVSATNMAAGAVMWSPVYTGLQWVRNIVVIGQSDQQYEVDVTRIDSTGTTDWGGVLSASAAATNSSWRSTSISGATALLGTSAKFGIKNTAATANTFGNLRIQLLGQ